MSEFVPNLKKTAFFKFYLVFSVLCSFTKIYLVGELALHQIAVSGV